MARTLLEKLPSPQAVKSSEAGSDKKRERRIAEDLERLLNTYSPLLQHPDVPTALHDSALCYGIRDLSSFQVHGMRETKELANHLRGRILAHDPRILSAEVAPIESVSVKSVGGKKMDERLPKPEFLITLVLKPERRAYHGLQRGEREVLSVHTRYDLIRSSWKASDLSDGAHG